MQGSLKGGGQVAGIGVVVHRSRGHQSHVSHQHRGHAIRTLHGKQEELRETKKACKHLKSPPTRDGQTHAAGNQVCGDNRQGAAARCHIAPRLRRTQGIAGNHSESQGMKSKKPHFSSTPWSSTPALPCAPSFERRATRCTRSSAHGCLRSPKHGTSPTWRRTLH